MRPPDCSYCYGIMHNSITHKIVEGKSLQKNLLDFYLSPKWHVGSEGYLQQFSGLFELLRLF